MTHDPFGKLTEMIIQLTNFQFAMIIGGLILILVIFLIIPWKKKHVELKENGEKQIKETERRLR